MTIYVCRHGRTDANASGLLLGRADPALDELGRKQAARIASVLPADALVFSSPLRRCIETAATYSGDVTTEPALLELDYGDFDLTSMGDIPSETMREWRQNPEFAPPNGESLQQLADRVGGFLDALSPVAAERDVVLFSHVSPIKASVAWALDVGIGMSWRSHVAQASITTIEVTGRGPSLHGFNRVDHLAGPDL
jgi:broad specificity phosphatase PhoE